MIKNDFFNELYLFLEIKSITALNETTVLKTLAEWDSMLIITIIAFIDQHFNKTVSAEQLNTIMSVGDLMKIIGSDNFE